MKSSFLLLFTLFVSSSVTAQSINRFRDSQTLDLFLQYQPTQQRPLILAHRGGPGPADTENSIVTFAKTSTALPDAILEMDVRMTRDSSLVLLHDATLDRESNANGAVSDWTFADLKKVLLKTLAGDLTKQTIPTLADVLNWNKNRYVLALDVKPGTDLVRVMNVVKKYNAEHSVFMICYSLADAQQMRKDYPTLWLAVGVGSLADIDKLEAASLSGRLIALTPPQRQSALFYERLHRHGIPCAIGTYGVGQLDEQPLPDVANRYRDTFRQGGDILTTDRPMAVSELF
ncbi:glycerophosphodiester phosphodiesterase family protein [Fibrella forsythiae]|uniref:Glycerophosphodiester phosphodiesterase family protein n=1 Tax=Fibrella forsythiae TaxID=2817061 RepID=A0ABS3JGD5_9BACT|nr:glycerophosphodiester phosphodiesterase family protein [Fibrella forsythiae]MBO0949076.1 glycerophosphodiester phosphodiesterase family protein [Fibrella forsythiae]